VDQFLKGLSRHLAPGGLAVMTHNVFLDFGKTQLMADSPGPAGPRRLLRVGAFARLQAGQHEPRGIGAFYGLGIHKMGDFWFVDFDLVEVSWKHEDA
jgi:release factor glutamine methyltransferase